MVLEGIDDGNFYFNLMAQEDIDVWNFYSIQMVLKGIADGNFYYILKALEDINDCNLDTISTSS